MEIIKIKSGHSLITSMTDNRPAGEHVYDVNCRQYLTTYGNWKRQKTEDTKTFGVMTLGYERIWVTEGESKQIAEAIQASSSPFVLTETEHKES